MGNAWAKEVQSSLSSESLNSRLDPDLSLLKSFFSDPLDAPLAIPPNAHKLAQKWSTMASKLEFVQDHNVRLKYLQRLISLLSIQSDPVLSALDSSAERMQQAAAAAVRMWAREAKICAQDYSEQQRADIFAHFLQHGTVTGDSGDPLATHSVDDEALHELTGMVAALPRLRSLISPLGWPSGPVGVRVIPTNSQGDEGRDVVNRDVSDDRQPLIPDVESQRRLNISIDADLEGGEQIERVQTEDHESVDENEQFEEKEEHEDDDGEDLVGNPELSQEENIEIEILSNQADDTGNESSAISSPIVDILGPDLDRILDAIARRHRFGISQPINDSRSSGNFIQVIPGLRMRRNNVGSFVNIFEGYFGSEPANAELVGAISTRPLQNIEYSLKDLCGTYGKFESWTILTHALRLSLKYSFDKIHGNFDETERRGNVFSLLCGLQRDLFLRWHIVLLSDDEENCEARKQASNYIVKYCEEILEGAASLFNTMRTLNISSSSFEPSFLSSVLPEFFLCFHASILALPYQQIVYNLLPKLITLLNAVDSYVSINNIMIGESHDHVSFLNFKVIESPHSYASGTQLTQSVCFPGSSHVLLRFDSKCSTERDLDILTISSPDGFSKSFSGKSRYWPKNTIIIPGDSISIEFVCKSVTKKFKHWGYRLSLYGTRKPEMKGINALVKCIAALTGDFLSIQAKGNMPSSVEIQLSKFLNSSLFQNGLESTDFRERKGDTLSGLIDKDPNSLAMKLDRLMNSQLSFHGTDLLGGSVVDDTVRLFKAVLIRHLGLETAAIQIVKEDSETSSSKSNLFFNQLLLKIWEMAKSFRQWIVSEKQRYQMILSEHGTADSHLDVTKEIKDDRGNFMDEPELKIAAIRASYTGLCSELNLKLEFLMNVVPAWSSSLKFDDQSWLINSSELQFSNLASELHRMSRINSSEARHQSLQNWKSVSETYFALQQWILKKNERSSLNKEISSLHGSFESLPDLIVAFVQSPPQFDIRSALNFQNKRAELRISAVEDYLRLLSSLKSEDATFAIISRWISSHPFRPGCVFIREQQEGGHFLKHIESASPVLRNSLYATLTRYLNIMNNMMESLKCSASEFAQATSAFSIELLPVDYRLLLPYVDVLKTHIYSPKFTWAELMSELQYGETNDKQMRNYVFVAFSTFYQEICFSGLLTEKLNPMQSSLIDALVLHLSSSFESLNTVDVLDAEIEIFFSLSALQRISCIAITPCHYLSKPILVNLLIDIFASGISIRIQRCCLNLLLLVLRNLSPTQIAKVQISLTKWLPANLKKAITLGHQCPSVLFDSLAQFFMLYLGSLCTLLPDGDSLNLGIGFYDGDSVSELISSLVMFLRALLNLALWKPSLQMIIFHSLNLVVDLREVVREEFRHRNIYLLLGSLFVVGGDFNEICIGTRVLTREGQEQGTVVHVDNYCNSYKVIFDKNPTKVCIVSDPSKLQIVKFSLPNDTISTVLHSLISIIHDVNIIMQPSQKTDSSITYQFLFGQIRSRCLKAFLVILSDPSVTPSSLTASLVHELMFHGLKSTSLNEFKSVYQLEEEEAAMRKAFLEQVCNLHSSAVYNPASQRQVLKYSPFVNEKVLLPCFIDVSSAVRLHFNDSTRLRFSSQHSSVPSNGSSFCRADRLIPRSLPIYYFEIVCEEPIIASTGNTWILSIGLSREGINQDESPGLSGCALMVGNGIFVSGSSSSLVLYPEEYFSSKVIKSVGCGWCPDSGKIYFCTNGEQIPYHENMNISGSFYPAVWIQPLIDHPEAINVFRLNLGQNQFDFDFQSTLPSRYRDFPENNDLSESNHADKEYSADELIRRTDAVALQSLYPDFPLEICILALENCNDDLMIAANWLMENGWTELERLINDTITRSAEEAERQFILQSMADETETSSTQMQSQVSSFPLNDEPWQSLRDAQYRDLLFVNQELSDESTGLSSFEMQEEVDSDIILTTDSSSSLFNSTFDSTTDFPRLYSPYSSNFQEFSESREFYNIDEITLGQFLQVSALTLSIISPKGGSLISDIAWASGRIGKVVDIDLNNKFVVLQIMDHERSCRKCLSLPVYVLHRPYHQLPKKIRLLLDNSQKDHVQLCQEINKHEENSAILKIRECILRIIKHDQDLFLSVLGDLSLDDFFCLLKLSASQALPMGHIGSNYIERTSDDSLSILRVIIEKSISKDTASEQKLIESLLNECIHHFETISSNPPADVIVETCHDPYESFAKLEDKVSIPGAEKLLITFDRRSTISTDVLTRLSFYKDPGYLHQITSFKGKEFRTLIIEGSSVFYRLKTSGDSNYWGVKFTVAPINLRFNDELAKNRMNLELAFWILDILLDSIDNVAFREHVLSKLISILTQFIFCYGKHSWSSTCLEARQRTIQFLSRVYHKLMYSKNSNDNQEPPSAHKFRSSFEHLIQSLLGVNNYVSGSPTPLLQTILESLAIVSSFYEKPSEDCKISNRLILVEEAWICDSRSSRLFDITEMLQRVSTVHKGSLLILPKNLQSWVQRLGLPSVILQEILKDENSHFQLHITYRFKSGSGDRIFEKTFNQLLPMDSNSNLGTNAGSYHVSLATDFTILERMQEMIQFIRLSDDRHRLHFPQTWICSSLNIYRLTQITHLHSIILQGEHYAGPDNILFVPDPSNGDSVSRIFTFSFWINPSSAEETQLIVRKGLITLAMEIWIHRSNLVAFIWDNKSNVCELYSKDIRITPSTWKHLCLSCDGDKVSFYVDGEFQCSSRKVRRPDNHAFSSFSVFLVPTGWYFGGLPIEIIHGGPGFKRLSGKNDDEIPQGFSGFVRDVRFSCKPLDDDLRYICSDRREILSCSYPDESLEFIPHFQVAQNQQIIELFTELEEHRLHKSTSMSTNIRESPLSSISLLQCNPSLLVAQSHFSNLMGSFPSLANFHPSDLVKQFLLLKEFNTRVSRLLPWIDFSQSNVRGTVSFELSKRFRNFVFFEVKASYWSRILSLSETGRRQSVSVNRPKALRAREKGNDIDGQKSIFGQVFQQLHFKKPSLLRTSQRAWLVDYTGEGGTDAGGLFRDSISAICEDLQSSHLRLLIPCPNSHGFGENQEKWVPNPSSTDSLHLAMYRFIGKLMGIAIRGGHMLNLDLPSMVWKPLVGETVSRDDLYAIDSLCFEVLEKMNTIQAEDTTDEYFTQVFPYYFTTISTDGREVELIPNGKNIPVTLSNRHEFVRLVLDYRINEFATQVKEIKKGLAAIVPVHLLSIFTWSELEMMVCGKKEVDIDLLKANTLYRGGTKASDEHVQMFWEVLKEFSHVERQKFLRFVWGQSRLPYHTTELVEKFTIDAAVKDSDESLPVSHTCFFSLELPRYSRRDIMRKKLIYAMQEGLPIDMDHNAQNVNWDEE